MRSPNSSFGGWSFPQAFRFFEADPYPTTLPSRQPQPNRKTAPLAVP